MSQFGQSPPKQFGPPKRGLGESCLEQLIHRQAPAPPKMPNPDVPALLEALAFANITKRRQYFFRQRINLDGLRFVECRFDDCELYTDTGNIYLQDCVLGIGNRVNFGPNAKKIVQLASILDPRNISPNLLAELKQLGSVVSVSVL